MSSLLDTYAYHQAALLVADWESLDPQAHKLLLMLKERRELNVAAFYESSGKMAELLDQHGLNQLSPSLDDELLVNYLYDLEAKVRNGQIIDFVRAVSPILYRLFLRLVKQLVPDLETYIHNARNDQYDRWLFDKMMTSTSPLIGAYLSQKRDSRVTTKSLVDLLVLSDLPQDIKDTALLLRQFEKSVRNPLAHLVKPFDEEELHRTTGFSSQRFLKKLIVLAKAAGLSYDQEIFYFDRVNQVIKDLLILSA